MHPIGSLLLGLSALALYALGGTVGAAGLAADLFVGFLVAVTPMPPRERRTSSWLAAPFFRCPLLFFSPSLGLILERNELRAVVAHEMWHRTRNDRAWRGLASAIGACAMPATALGLLRYCGEPTLWLFADLLATLSLAVATQTAMLWQSERRADNEATRIVGSTEPLARAIGKLGRAGKEVWGMSPEEAAQRPQDLQAAYLARLGGFEATLRVAPPEEIHPAANLSLVGEFVTSLVDGQRTVRAICDAAAAKDPVYDEFTVVRVLAQLYQVGVVKSAGIGSDSSDKAS